jgi:hypothetical protein
MLTRRKALAAGTTPVALPFLAMARKLGVNIPQSLPAGADRVIG